MNSIALFYGHVARNVGDIAINRGEVALLRAAYPEAAINVVLLNAGKSQFLTTSSESFGPDGAVRLIHVSANDSQAFDFAISPARWLETCGVADADLIALAAGEHLFSYEKNDNYRNLFWRALPAFAARHTGKRCLIFPSTFGPYETADARALVSQLLDTQPRIAARDAISASMLEALSAETGVELALDPAFFIEPPAAKRSRRKRRAIGLVMRSEQWGLRLAADDRSAFKADDAERRERDIAFRFSLGLCRRILAESDADVRMFIQTEADRPIADALAESLADIPGASRFKPVAVNTIDEYIEALGEVDCVIASRFHALILGMVCGKPGFGVYFEAHGHKIPGLMQLLGQPEDCLNLSKTPIETSVDVAYSNCVEKAPDFGPLRQRLDELRRHTSEWLGAEWPELTARHGLELRESQPLLRLASSLVFSAHQSESRLKAAAVAKETRQAEEKASSRIEKEQARAAELRDQTRQLKGELRTTTARLEKEQAKAAELGDQTRQLKSELKTTTARLEKEQARAAELGDLTRQMKVELDKSVARIRKGEIEARKLSAQAYTARHELEGTKTRLEAEEARAREFSAQAYQLKTTLDRTSARLEKEETRAREFSALAHQLKGELKKADTRLEKEAAKAQEFSALAYQLKGELKQVTTRLEREEARAQEFSALAYQTKGELKQVTTRLDTEIVRAKEFSAQAYQLRGELKKATARIAKGDEQREKLLERSRQDAGRLAMMRKRVDQIEDSASFRVGRALVMTGRSPRNLMLLPREVLRIRKERREKRSEAAAPKIEAAPTPNQPAIRTNKPKDLARIFQDRGSSGVIEHLQAGNPDDRAALRDALVAAGKDLAHRGFPEAEIELTRKAVEIDESDASLRAFYWAAQRAGDLPAAWESIRMLLRLYGENPTRGQRAFLDKARRSAAYQLSLLDRVPDQPERLIEPVAGRLCYVLHNSLPYSSGGYASRAHGLAAGLMRAGLEVVTLTRPGFPLDSKPDLTAADVPVEETIDGHVHRRLMSPMRKGMAATDYVEAAADAITEALVEIRPSFVMAASNYQTALPALIAARRLGLPFFYEIRGFWEITRISREPEFVHDPAYKIQELMEAETARRADHVFTLTNPMKQEMIRRGLAAEHITLLPNSCEPERFTPRPRDEALAARLGIPAGVPVIGYIGTFVQYEGLELLVAAAADLRDKGHVFRLLLVGNENVSGQDAGPITTEIRRISSRRGLDDWLLMPGRVPHDEVEAYYSLIDIAPFPRKAQPVTEMVSPMKPLEAYAMEKAVVASSVGALLEMVDDGRTGLVFEKDNVESLAEALARLIADPGLRERLGKAGRQWVEAERTWDATARIAIERMGLIDEPPRQ